MLFFTTFILRVCTYIYMIIHICIYTDTSFLPIAFWWLLPCRRTTSSSSSTWPCSTRSAPNRRKPCLGGIGWIDPQNGWFVMENPNQKLMIWGYPYFRKLPFLFIGMNMHMMMRQSYMCTMRCENPELWTDNTPAISSRWIICNWIYKALCIW